MRSSIILTAAFAVTAFSTPLKRDVIVETDTATEIDYVTDIVTVTEGGPAPTSVAAAATTSSQAAGGYHWGHHHHHSSAAPSSAAPVSSSAAPAPSSSQAPAPAPTTSEAPAPAPTTSEAPAPAPTSSEAPAPSSYSAPASPVSSAPATPASSAASGGFASVYPSAVVNHHNYHRANHSAPDVTWNQDMADIAQEIANSCVYAHDMTKGTYGQNIAIGVEANNISTIISDMFYNGEVSAFNGNYGIPDPTGNNFEAWGHFSQIVWKGTTSVGCATHTCSQVTDSKGNVLSYPPHFTVCNYSPPGNFQGEFNTNVAQSLGEATITWSKDVPAAGVQGDGY